MSQRRIPTADDAMAALLREILDRLDGVESLKAFAGLVSFGNTIQVGGVQIIVSGGTGAKTVTFKNLDTGATHVITL